MIDLLVDNDVEVLNYTTESAHYVRVTWGKRSEHLEVKLYFLRAIGIFYWSCSAMGESTS